MSIYFTKNQNIAQDTDYFEQCLDGYTHLASYFQQIEMTVHVKYVKSLSGTWSRPAAGTD